LDDVSYYKAKFLIKRKAVSLPALLQLSKTMPLIETRTARLQSVFLSTKRQWGLITDRPFPSGGKTVSLQSGETLADLKPRMVLGYGSLICTNFDEQTLQEK
jgi:hypothetical protein